MPSWSDACIWPRRKSAASVASKTGIEPFSTSDPRSGQSVFHMHVHLIGGRDMRGHRGRRVKFCF